MSKEENDPNNVNHTTKLYEKSKFWNKFWTFSNLRKKFWLLLNFLFMLTFDLNFLEFWVHGPLFKGLSLIRTIDIQFLWLWHKMLIFRGLVLNFFLNNIQILRGDARNSTLALKLAIWVPQFFCIENILVFEHLASSRGVLGES